ncbi:hypothetical protein P4234_16075 [Pseudomonas aeruginosa]|nr:hypothetical protein [Pseudomonas aeruginosa]
METRLPQVREGLAQVRSPDLPAAEDFVRRLEQAQRWLGPLFERDKSACSASPWTSTGAATAAWNAAPTR